MKTILQNWMDPEEEDEVVEEVEKFEPIVSKTETKQPKPSKVQKPVDKFDELFEEDEEKNDLPF